MHFSKPGGNTYFTEKAHANTILRMEKPMGRVSVMSMILRMSFIFIVLIMMFPGLVRADLMGTYSLREGNVMVIEYRDDNNFRINIGPDGYVLMNNGKAYMVSKQDGKWEAVSVESMKAMMDRMGFGARMQETMRDSTPPRFEDTGRTERIAGISGKVYVLTAQKPNGQTETAEVVFSQDARLQKLQQANIRLADAWGNPMQKRQGPSIGEMLKRYQEGAPAGGILRYAEEMRLISIQETELAASRFALPTVRSLNFPAGMPPQQTPPSAPVITAPPSSPPAKQEEEGRLSKGAKRIGDRAAKKTEDTISEKVDSGVQKGVDSLLKGIFGN